MKHALKRQLLIPAAATLLFTVCGGVAGYLLARAHTMRALFDKVQADAVQNAAVISSFLDESRSLLAVLNHPSQSFCSDEEVDYFRQLVFRTQNLRDMGRIREGRLECSALFGRKHLPSTQYKPAMIQVDGTRMYRNIPPYVSDKAVVFVLQQGDSFVVEDPNYDSHIQQVSPNTEITMLNLANQRKERPIGLASAIPDAVKDKDWSGNDGDLLYVTRCVPRNYLCSSAYGSQHAALWNDRGRVISYVSLGSLTAILPVLIFWVIRLRNRSMSNQLRRAIRQDKVKLVYQPILDLSTGRIVEAEALSRWTDEDGFQVSPEVFVRLAEERGFVGELTAMVVRQALRDFRELLRSGSGFRLNINVSASDLSDPSFLPMLEQSLAAAGVEPQHLAIELTESATACKQQAIETIRQLRERGHCVQLDDFGTGYSSLAYLKDLAVDALKIDRSFTQAIGTEAVIGAILPQILAMAEALDLLVIVEGIETEEQARYFAVLERPVMGQGWFFGRPVPADVFHANLVSAEAESGSLRRSA
jgi:sensor c-di-GMP phosphodiesterase-like protein